MIKYVAENSGKKSDDEKFVNYTFYRNIQCIKSVGKMHY